MVLYRKYRPQKLEELDSIEIRTRLAKVISSSYLPHAFLFAGPKGTGKTSAARIMAKVLNCVRRGKNTEPCNSCETCDSIRDGRNLDVLEIDAASNRGIEEIRDLRDKIRLAPLSCRYKVYIIDEVHMLTNEAFNALLKTLEEPPSHAVFILATTEMEKLPETILSRCIKFNFHKATILEIKNSLSRVVAGEKFKIDRAVLDKIGEFADGSFRDATKLLEQAVSEDVTTIDKFLSFHGRDTISPDKLLSLIISKKTQKSLEAVENLVSVSADFKIYTTEILKLLHDLLLKYHGISTPEVPEELFKSVDLEIINSLIKLFSKVYIELKNSPQPELPLEVAIVEWCESKGGGS